MAQQNDNCVFCRICNEEEQSEILYKVYDIIHSGEHNVPKPNLGFVSQISGNVRLNSVQFSSAQLIFSRNPYLTIQPPDIKQVN